MLGIFFKRKDYKEVTVKYLDQLTNDIEKLQVKRIAGMTAANEFTSKNIAYMEASHVVEKSQSTYHSKASRDSNRTYEDSIREVVHNHPSRSYSNHGSKHHLALLTDLQDSNTSQCSTLVTPENKTSDSIDVPRPETTRKSHTLSRKVMAERMDNMLKEIIDLKTKLDAAVSASTMDVNKVSLSFDGMHEEISGLKAMISLIVAESRKNTAGSAEVNVKLHEEIEDLKTKLSMMAAITSEKESRFMSCAAYKTDDSSSDVDEKEHPSAATKKNSKWLDRDYFCGSGSSTSFHDCFSFIKCPSSLD